MPKFIEKKRIENAISGGNGAGVTKAKEIDKKDTIPEGCGKLRELNSERVLEN